MVDILPALVPVLAVIVAPISALAGVWLTVKTTEKREQIAYSRVREAARSDRLRSSYIAMLRAMDAMADIAMKIENASSSGAMPDGTLAERAPYVAMLAEAFDALDDA